MIKGINAVLIHSRDVRRLAEFYRDKVGIPFQMDDHGGGLHAEAEVGSVHVAIFPGGGEPRDKGPVTLSLNVDDIDAEYEAMKKRGVSFEGPPAPAPFGGVLASFRDPDGNGVLLMVWQSERKAE